MNTKKQRVTKRVNMKKRKIILGITTILMAILIVNLVSADNYWVCFKKGDKINWCPYMPSPIKPETCKSSIGCPKCISVFDSANNCYIPGSYPKCLHLPPTCNGISNGNDSGTLDTVPPVFTLTSPTNGAMFTSRMVPIQFSTNEEANVYFTDIVNGRGRWTKVCSNCVSYSRNLSFSDGLDQIQFKAVDLSGNAAYTNVSFLVDSKKPKILKTLPKTKDFGNGEFEVDFQEANPSTLTLFYGNNGSSNMNVALSNCVPSTTSNEKQHCIAHADLSSYNGQKINYWFTLTDTVGNSVSSKPVNNINVDLTPPVVNNPGSFYSYQNGSRYVYFNLSITEVNFEDVSYSYTDSKGKLKDAKLCTTLKNGFCSKKVSFTKGSYSLTVSIVDQAGNSIGLPANFVVNY